MIAALGMVAQLAVVARAPETVAACEAVEVTVAVSAPGRTPPAVVAPSFAPFAVLRSSVAPQLTFGSGAQGGVVAEYRYLITTEQTGRFVLPSFVARLGTEVSHSNLLSIEVTSSQTSTPMPTIVARARVDTSLDVNFRALTLPETVFVGQQTNYEVAVFLNETVRERLRRNPTFYPPDMQSMLAYDLPSVEASPPRRRVGTRCFDALVYQRALFPLLPGRFVIPPAQLAYSLALSSSFFSREESRDLQTDSTIIVAVEPPPADRPADFTGAVGDLRLTAKLDSTVPRVGDPVLLTVRISGTGNVKLFPRPRVVIPWASLVPAEERVHVDSTARHIRGDKEFDWVLTPRVAGDLAFPPVRYPYFNPETRRYAVASSNPTRMRIASGALVASDTGATKPALTLRADYGTLVSTWGAGHPVFWLLLALAPIPALALRAKAPRMVPAQSSAIATLRAVGRRDGKIDPWQLRRLFARALTERLELDMETFTRPGALARALRRSGVSGNVAADAESFLRQLDEAAYALDGVLPAGAVARATSVYAAADSEALERSELWLRRARFGSGSSARALCVAGLGVAAGWAVANGSVGNWNRLWAATADDPRSVFAHGVSAYYHGRYSDARDAFARSSAAEPSAPNSWANMGTAAWADGDTARAVAGWERALQLDPLSDDIRDRLQLVHSVSMASPGYVIPIPVAWLIWIAALGWVCGWTLAALAASGRAAAGRRWAIGVGIASAVIAAAGLEVSERGDVRRLAVIRGDAALRSAPALGTEREGSAGTGEVARITGREGYWVRVALDGEREGWVEAREVIPLESAATLSD